MLFRSGAIRQARAKDEPALGGEETAVDFEDETRGWIDRVEAGGVFEKIRLAGAIGIRTGRGERVV